MEMKQYLQDSARTDAPFEQLREDIFPTHRHLAYDLVDIIVGGQTADLAKRAIFYNEPVEKVEARANKYAEQCEKLYQVLSENTDKKFTDQDIGILHAALGMMSEAAEIIEEVVNSFVEDRELNLDNLKEEGGDSLWYNAKFLRDIGSNFETEAARNIAKLLKRFPEKFSQDKALNRDLDAEKTALNN